LTWLSIGVLTAVAFIFAYFVNSMIVGAVSSTVADTTGRALKPEALDSIHSWMAVGYTVMGVVTIAGLLRGSVRLRR
jgi:Na+/H+ antiporter NhaC